ncbi:Receptor expression-enhancing protein [Caenorhabditis elegans]|uniref:Receptor expression-enhancing protein n=1 Tax=Caenorhabditis elegans TaxID=6239 RepID=Q8WQD3_CAEEL|nr:Receptor expression-enhancing protein [Caenorhabditis elegans]CAD21647.3 Receptor expression-enhancing protein [Caenorhabditis elegans]|eukprot:NP_499756.3 Receptor expression-enhancing protein [Caenorhabditis elegans]
MSMTKNPVKSKPADGTTSAKDFENLQSDFFSFLYADHGPFYKENVKKLEDATGLKREMLAYGLIGLNCVYMIIGSGAEFVCNLIGVAYPAYVSVKAIRTEGTDDDTMWLIYWTVFGAFSIIDFFAASIMSYFPIYWVAKAAFLLYLYLPETHGSHVIYHQLIDPFVAHMEKSMSRKLPANAGTVPNDQGSALDANNNVIKPDQPPPQ